MSLLIKNGTVVNPAKKQNEVADVLVKDGKIEAIGQNLSAEGAEVYDATGLIGSTWPYRYSHTFA